MNKIPVGVLGATGLVGQRLLTLLDGHEWFQVRSIAASDNSVGKIYALAVKWQQATEIPEAVREMTVQPCDPERVPEALVFSALPSDVAGEIEVNFARAGAIVSSNASAHRMDDDVPLVIPEVNPEHLGLVSKQQAQRNWEGYIICNANCSTIHLTLALKPLADRFGLRRIAVTTMQALSGAGYPGVASLDILDNVIPYIGGEEEKLEQEPLKILGQFEDGRIVLPQTKISAQCNRVATRDGHLETVSIEFVEKPNLDQVVTAFREFRGLPQALHLPTAPVHPVLVKMEKDRPQVKLDRDLEKGMATIVGRLRECNVLDLKFVLLGHNTLRGAAGGTLLNAELLAAQGMLQRHPASAMVEASRK